MSVQQIHPEVETQPTDTSTMRVPQGVLLGTGAMRSGRIDEVRLCTQRGVFPIDDNVAHWTVVPAAGTTLVLPFPDRSESGVTIERALPRPLLAPHGPWEPARRTLTTTEREKRLAETYGSSRAVLTGGLLMTYLSTWALWAMQADPAGRFDVRTSDVAALRGFTAYGAGYGKPMHTFRKDLERLCALGVAQEKLAPEPMLRLLAKTRAVQSYQHAAILLSTLRGEAGGFAQVPIRALRLGAHDGGAVVALAAFWRRTISTAKGYHGPLRGFLTELGLFNPKDADKRGRAYWPDCAKNLQRIAKDGAFGSVWFDTDDILPTTPIVVTPSDELVAAYGGLHEARERAKAKADAVDREVEVRKRLPARRNKTKAR